MFPPKIPIFSGPFTFSQYRNAYFSLDLARKIKGFVSLKIPKLSFEDLLIFKLPNNIFAFILPLGELLR